MDEYARFASLYDPIVGPFLRPIHKAIISTLTKAQSATTLDLCCGTGLLAGMASKAGIQVTGVDISQPMLQVAHIKYPTIRFIQEDASSLSFEDNAFDALTISFALHEKPLSTASAILYEGMRVVKPGGMLLIADYRFPTTRRSRWTGLAIKAIERLAGKEHSHHFNQFMAQGGSESFLYKAGLPGKPIDTFMHGWVGLFVATNP